MPNINSKILLSVASIAAAAALVVGATFAFFSDTETSSGNTFAAGTLDLKVNYDCYYNKPADGDPNCPFEPNSWTETDLGPEHKFFNFDDIKPGDFGEGTISLHVIDNDAWAKLVISNVQDLENTFLQAELDAGDAGVPDGELQENLVFSIWLDEGAIPGFQGQGNDLTEGNNIQDGDELTLVTQGTVDPAGETHNIWQGLVPYRAALDSGGVCDTSDPDGDGQTGGPNVCQGLATDGRLVGSVTYYFGIAWTLPGSVGNEVETDSLSADMTIEAAQHRNNPGQVF